MSQATGQDPAGLIDETLEHGGRNRSYLLDLGAESAFSEQRPLVVVLHGGRGTAERMAATLDFDEIGESEGLVVAYPRAIGRTWNDGRGVARYLSHREKIDDVGFLASLVDRLTDERGVDPDRVFVTGPSNGGMMSLRLALEAPGRFAAVAAVIANLPRALAVAASDGAEPRPTVPILLLNGTDDPLMPHRGGEITFAGRGGFGYVLSTTRTARTFADLQGCTDPPRISRLPNSAPFDGTRVVLHRYEGGSTQCDLSLYVIRGGGHTWPGAPSRLPRSLVGRASRDIDATELVWEFFSQRSR